MRRLAVVVRWLAFLCSLILVYSAVQALGVGPFEGIPGEPPNWVDGPLYWIVSVNVILVLLIVWRGVTPGVAAALVAGGITTLLAVGVFQSFQGGIQTPLAGRSIPAAIILTAIGIWRFDARTLHEEHWNVSGAVIVLGVGLGALSIEAIFGAISTTIWLLPVLWVNGLGSQLAPLAVLVGVRWMTTTGVRIDNRLGFRKPEHTGVTWDRGAVVHFGNDPQLVRAGFIVVTTIGIIVILLTPTVHHYADSALPTGHTLMLCNAPTWAANLDYRADWTAMHIRWADGCNGKSAFVNWRYGTAGGSLVLIGAVGERLSVIRER